MRCITLVLLFVCLILAEVSQAGMRCGTHIVTEGDLWTTVAKKCGAPDFLYPNPDYYISTQEAENWVYDRTPNGFLIQVKVIGGKVSRIEKNRQW